MRLSLGRLERPRPLSSQSSASMPTRELTSAASILLFVIVSPPHLLARSFFHTFSHHPCLLLQLPVLHFYPGSASTASDLCGFIPSTRSRSTATSTRPLLSHSLLPLPCPFRTFHLSLQPIILPPSQEPGPHALAAKVGWPSTPMPRPSFTAFLLF